MKNNTDMEKSDYSYLELLTQLKDNVLNSKYLNNDNPIDSLQPDEIIAKIVAAFCLENNIKAEKFNTLFRYQLVKILKKTEPDLPNVQISARTGINRRGITSLSKTPRQSKDMLVLSYLKSYCQKYKTTLIPKKGYCDSFESFCQLGANGSLTSASIAKELIRQGVLKDKVTRYQIILNKEGPNLI